MFTNIGRILRKKHNGKKEEKKRMEKKEWKKKKKSTKIIKQNKRTKPKHLQFSLLQHCI